MDERVLVIDDTPVIRGFLEEVLTDFGFEVDIAENGREGVDKVSMNDYLLIFCDVHMPIMNGLQAVKEIKKIRPEVAIIMTDSYPDREVKEAIQAGASHCLTKPFDLNELRATINNLLKKRTYSST